MVYKTVWRLFSVYVLILGKGFEEFALLLHKFQGPVKTAGVYIMRYTKVGGGKWPYENLRKVCGKNEHEGKEEEEFFWAIS